MRISLIFVLAICFSVVIKGQQNNTLFLMHNLPQANIVNPAVPIECKLFVGFPGIGSTHVNAYSTGFSLSDVLVSTDTDSLRFEPDGAISKFRNKEMIATETHLSLISVGYKYKNNYFTFGINEKVNSHVILNKNAVLLVNGGNSQFEGQRVKMNGTRANAVHYREYALGWAREVTARLSFGVRLKFLFGKANFYSAPTDLSLYTDDVTFDTYVSGKASIYTSFPIEITTDADGKLDQLLSKDDVSNRDYLMNKANKGYGVDVGFIYQLDESTTLSGSLLDIGYINWQSDPYQLKSGGSMDITGEAIDEGLGNLGEVTDSLANVFTPSVLNRKYMSPLVPAMYVGVSRYFNDWFAAGAVFHTEMYNSRLHPSFTLSANTTITKNIYASASYTLQNREFNNVGVGLGAKFGFLHLHAISDNLPGLFDLGGTRNVNLRFGLSMLFGCGRDKSKKDKGIRAIPCIGDPYNAIKSRRHR